MQVIRSIEDMRAATSGWKAAGQRVGCVPTMGALHQGHLSLVDIARAQVDVTVVTLFVNPAQFGPSEDFSKYPRDEEGDLEMCRRRGVDAVFLPAPADIYPKGYSTYVTEEAVSEGLEGSARPGHFRGVCTVVLVLFNIVQPHLAVFGEKDAQQLSVLKKMVADLRLDIEILPGPTVREPDGLAMSSRNRYLNPHQRKEAALIHEALQAGKRLVHTGTVQVERVQAEIHHVLGRSNRLRINYVSIVDPDTFRPLKRIEPGRSLICVAAWLEQVRLIDNLRV
ncbi:MAG: pantoate--beta-alanine ligase [Opitutales bacterium]